MTYLVNAASTFVDEMIDGFVAVYRPWVRRVTGGVVRATGRTQGQVAVVIGGGSGHYPAFAGLVGPGLAHGAAMGNVFASPSAHQVYSVAKAAHSGGGVLLSYGNYAGDVLNFDQAQAQLNLEGIECRTVVVTDDVASATAAEHQKRRGIAGDLVVFKVAAAAAERGMDLDDVVKVAARANGRTRTLGVAFSGCTLPGACRPLFTVPAGRMAVGMGLHGEPGIDEVDLPTADALAEMLVDRLLAERPDDARADARAVVLVNGLGSIKSEELFVIYRGVARLLNAAGVTIVEPEVGEFATSFEMAGLSLTLFWLDDELEALWSAAASTPAYRKGHLEVIAGTTASALDGDADASDTVAPASDASRACAGMVVRALAAAKRAIDDNANELGRLDAIAGDGDHGIGMQRGATAAAAAAHDASIQGAGVGTVLQRAGDAWADKAGGTSGALWGVILRTMGDRIGDAHVPSVATTAEAVARARDAVQQFGKAHVGDKTLLDTLAPFADVLSGESTCGSGASLAQAWGSAAAAAAAAAQATAQLVPKVGRARPHAAKSRGVPDPGAVSMAMIIRAVYEVLQEQEA